MLSLATEKIQVISSIPGRIRFNIGGLYMDEILEYKIINIFKHLKGIKNISFNRNTGNILVLYDSEALNEVKILKFIKNARLEQICNRILWENQGESIIKTTLKGLDPLNFLRKKAPEKPYEEEYLLSKRLIKVGLIFGGFLLAITVDPINIFSVAILSYPGMLFAISAAAYYYVRKISSYHDVYIVDNKVAKLLGKTTAVTIEDKLLLKEKKIQKTLIENYPDRKSLEKLVILEKMENPIKPEGEIFIKNFRRYGVTDIALYSEDENPLGEYAAYYLGISRGKGKKLQQIYKEDDHSKRVATIINYKNTIKHSPEISGDLHIRVHQEALEKRNDEDISILEKNIIRIPQTLRLSQITEELVTRSQVMGITINTIALFLSLMGKIDPILALGIYGINLLIQVNILQNNIQHEKGAIFYEYK